MGRELSQKAVNSTENVTVKVTKSVADDGPRNYASKADLFVFQLIRITELQMRENPAIAGWVPSSGGLH